MAGCISFLPFSVSLSRQLPRLSLSHTHTTHTHTPREGSFLLFTYLVAEESLDSDHRQGKPEDQTGRCVVENHPEEETRKKDRKTEETRNQQQVETRYENNNNKRQGSQEQQEDHDEIEHEERRGE